MMAVVMIYTETHFDPFYVDPDKAIIDTVYTTCPSLFVDKL